MASLSRLRSIFTPNSSFKITPNSLKIPSPVQRARKLEKLVVKFKASSESRDFRARRDIYESMVRRLTFAKKFSAIEEILDAQKKYKEDMSNEGFVVRLITLYGKAGMYEQAHKLFDEMPQFNCQRTAMSFNALLTAYMNCKRLDQVKELFKEMPSKMSIETNPLSYNILIQALCDMGSYDLAISMLDKMEENGLEPNLVTFNILLNALYGSNRFMEGERIRVLMESKKIGPDTRTYNARLRGLAKDDRVSEAVDLIKEMEEKGIKLSAFSFHAVIEGFCLNKKLEKAKYWYQELRRSECSTPNQETFKILLAFLCEEGELDMALEICIDMVENSLLNYNNVLILKCVVDRLLEEGKTAEAEKLVELGRSKKYKIDFEHLGQQ